LELGPPDTTEQGWHAWKMRYNPDGTSELIHVSEGMQELYGYSEKELLTAEAWRRLIPEEELPQIEEASRRVIAEGSWHGRVRIRPNDGDILIIEMASVVESAVDGTIIVAGRLRDVTERAALEAQVHEREARLEVLNERLRLVMWSCDPKLRLTWSWGSGLKDLGLKDNDAVGMTLLEFFGTDDESFTPIAAERKALQGERVAYEFAWKGRHYRCAVEPHLGPLGDVIGSIGTAIDVTEQRTLEEESMTLGREVGAPRLSAEATWAAPNVEDQIKVGALTIDLDAFEVRKDGRLIELTPTEFRLLVEMASRPGRVVTRKVLLQRVWGRDFLGSNSLITMAISRLRGKIEDDPAEPKLVENVRGVGYRLMMPDR
jgi:PAS domain S-box-containing protein